MDLILVTLIFLTIIVIGYHSYKKSYKNIFEPVYYVLVGYFLIFVSQYLARRDSLLLYFGEEHVVYCLVIVLVSILIFYSGYRSRIAKKLSDLLPKPPKKWRPGVLIPYGFFLCFLGLLGYIYFINQSGGPVEYFSVPRGGGAYEESTAYFYGAKWLLLPGLVILITELRHKRKRSDLINLITFSIAVFYFLYQIFIGQRSGIFAVGLTLLAAYLLPQNKYLKIKIKNTILFGIIIIVFIGFVSLFRGEFYIGSPLEGVKEFFKKPFYIQIQDLIIEGTLKGGTSESFEGNEITMYMTYIKIIPEYVDYDYGKFYLQYLFHWIPRIIWTGKPNLQLEKKFEIERVIGTSHISGPAVTMLGMYHLHFGIPGIIFGVFFTGVILGALEYWRKLNPNNYGILLIYIMFSMSGLGAVVSNGLLAGLPDKMLWSFFPILGAFIFIKLKTRRKIYSNIPIKWEAHTP